MQQSINRVFRLNLRAAFAAILALATIATTGDVGAAGRVRTQPLKAGDISTMQARIDATTIPGRSGPVRIEKTQAFSISGTGFEGFWLLPVRFEVVNQSGYTVPQPRCGMFVFSKTAQLQFVPYEWPSVLRCNRLKGVGVMEGKIGAPPSILLLYAASTLPEIPVQQPVVLDWDPEKARYSYNEPLSRRLEDDEKVSSIMSMKRQLKSY